MASQGDIDALARRAAGMNGAAGLDLLLAEAPFDNAALKPYFVDACVNYMTSKFSPSDIEPAVGALPADIQDTLMKVIYAGLANPDKSAGLFTWHAAVVKICGLGCIIRTLVDKTQNF